MIYETRLPKDRQEEVTLALDITDKLNWDRDKALRVAFYMLYDVNHEIAQEIKKYLTEKGRW